jgi:hypothetical protein
VGGRGNKKQVNYSFSQEFRFIKILEDKIYFEKKNSANRNCIKKIRF